MEIVYAVNARLGGGGIGNTSYYAALGPARAQCLKRVICNSNAQSQIAPMHIRSLGAFGRVLRRVAFEDKSGTLNDWVDIAFDYWAARTLEPATLVHCWNGLPRTLARSKSKGAIAVLECSMSHPAALGHALRQAIKEWNVGSSDLPSPRRLKRYLEELAVADFVTVPSEFNYRTYVAGGIPATKLRVVQYGVDLHTFSPPSEHFGGHPFRALFAGTFSLRKGAPYLLDAWKNLGWRDAELWIAGLIAPEMESFVIPYRNLPGIRFLGHQKNVRDLYHQADVFVLPSLGEGSALVSYEAMACGLPVIVSENSGALARHDIDGRVVSPANSPALCEALEWMRSHPSLRLEMGKNARHRIEPYTWESYGDRLVQSYRELTQT